MITTPRPALAPLDRAVLDVLGKVQVNGRDAWVGDGDAHGRPSRTGWQGATGEAPFVPYAVYYPLNPMFDGSVGTPDDTVELVFQVTSVGDTRLTARALSDAFARRLVPENFPTEIGVLRVVPERDSRGPSRDDTETPPLYYAPDRYRLWAFPQPTP